METLQVRVTLTSVVGQLAIPDALVLHPVTFIHGGVAPSHLAFAMPHAVQPAAVIAQAVGIVELGAPVNDVAGAHNRSLRLPFGCNASSFFCTSKIKV